MNKIKLNSGLKEKFKATPKKWLISGVSLLLVLVLLITLLIVNNRTTYETTYKETTVSYGDLVVGVSESGTIDIGTVDQTFDLDMSALSKVATSNTGSSSQSQGGGMDAGGFGGGSQGGDSMMQSVSDMFSQVLGMGSGTTSQTTSDSDLVIASVEVSVGQKVEEGDIIYVLEEEGVSDLTSELEGNVTKAQADLEALKADQEISKQEAEYTRDLAISYGSYASTEKASTIHDLEEAVSSAKSDLEAAEASLTAYTERLATAETELADATNWENQLKSQLDSINGETDTAYYVQIYDEYKEEKQAVETLEQRVENLTSNKERAEESVTNLTASLAKAERSLASGKITAEETYELRLLAYQYADETYDITMAYLEDDLADEQEIYDEAKEKWDEYTTYIDGNYVKAAYSGIVTEIGLSEGDSLTTGAKVISLYDTDDVTVTVSVDEDDMTDIALGTAANISVNAYPDTVFEASVTDIGDATTDSSGNTTVDVTVTISSDVSGLFQGMTADVTFITKNVKEVTYVSNRAITREGTRSYVKVYDDRGNIVTKEVTTGFSDGVNVEITDGLSEGDVCLIESKVSK